MITVEALQTEVRDLKRRLELTESRVTQMEGRFEFVVGQLRDIQLYMHAKFGDIEDTLSEIKNSQSEMKREQSEMKREQSSMNAKIDALPRVLAEMLAKR
jgi:chromosome segregation ATPase